MTTIHLVSHTHWDREWYLPFQQFRLRLVSLVDKLLTILDDDPEYRYFMLDGQTVILDDYLQMRPENFARLKKYILDGRILIGPWHVLPDEFLVSPEATVRNLLLGDREAAQFGQKMMVGYIPDPFGHLAQMPQILRGFDIDTASVERGLSDEPCEFLWQSPDGSSVFMLYERDGYGNAANLPVRDPEATLLEVQRLVDSLSPHTRSSHLLLLHGTDHMMPDETTPSTLAWLNGRLDGIRIVHSTLPEMITQARTEVELSGMPLKVICGELRDYRRWHLLPGVLSARMWIKQQNHACENLLERWCEPFSTLGNLALGSTSGQPYLSANLLPNHIYHPEGVLRNTWRMLMECHPHDSICGCSIDQVHDEMRSRLDQVVQIGEDITSQSLMALTGQISTLKDDLDKNGPALIVFNPSQQKRTDRVTFSMQHALAEDTIEIIDETNHPMPYRILGRSGQIEISRFELKKTEIQEFLAGFNGYGFADLTFETATYRKEDGIWYLDGWFKHGGQPNLTAWNELYSHFKQVIETDTAEQFELRLKVLETLLVEMIAGDVPGIGYRTYWIKPGQVRPAHGSSTERTDRVENEYFAVTLDPKDGSIAVLDKGTGITYPGLNCFVDGGDGGDEYNYSPPSNDSFVTPQVINKVKKVDGRFQDLEIDLRLSIPASLSSDRQSRSDEITDLEIKTCISLAPGIPRVDIHTEVDNHARDHRLQVHFPVPHDHQLVRQDGHYEIAERSILLPKANSDWVEDPVQEKPQRSFSDLSTGDSGLMIANRGLPEISIRSLDSGKTEMALTLLRCVGWLSRNDLSTRRGDAGPEIETPGAQMLGHWEFDYSIIPHQGDWLGASAQADFFDLPMRTSRTTPHCGSLPSTVSLVSIQPDEFKMTALKTTEDGQGWIIRGYNPLSKPMSLRLKPFFKADRVEKARLDETPLQVLPIEPDGMVTCQVRGHEIITLRLTSMSSD